MLWQQNSDGHTNHLKSCPPPTRDQSRLVLSSFSNRSIAVTNYPARSRIGLRPPVATLQPGAAWQQRAMRSVNVRGRTRRRYLIFWIVAVRNGSRTVPPPVCGLADGLVWRNSGNEMRGGGTPCCTLDK